MKITFRYSVFTKEGAAIPNVEEVYYANSEEEKVPVRARWNELKSIDFVANLVCETDNAPQRRVVSTNYTPNGTKYNFEVDFKCHRGMCLEVEDTERPGKYVYVCCLDTDRMVNEANLGFDPKRLRKARRIA